MLARVLTGCRVDMPRSTLHLLLTVLARLECCRSGCEQMFRFLERSGVDLIELGEQLRVGQRVS